MIPVDTLNTLFATWSSLDELCATLTETQWKTPTACPGWSVQDVVSHLIDVEREMLGLEPTTHRSPPRDYVKNQFGESTEHEVDFRRSLTGAQVFAEWNEIVARRSTELHACDDAYFTAPTMTPIGPGTVFDFLQLRILDCWIHEQDIRRALNLRGHESGPAAEHTIDRLTRSLPMVIGKRVGTLDGESVHFLITGPVKRSLYLTVHDGRAAFVDLPPVHLRTGFSTDSNTFVELAAGRATAEETASRWSAEGDTEHALRIAQNLNIMI